jgi:hypothetical protein
MQGQPPLNRFINGGRPSLTPNGTMPNGVATGLPQASMQVGGGQPPAPFPMGVPGSQLNGIGGPPPTPNSSAPQPPNFQPMLPGQRPGMGPQRQAGMPFQSPTMAHSPQNTGGAPAQQQHSQPPMGQLGPSPHLAHMNRGMHPPNGPQGMPQSGMGGGQPTNTPTPSLQNLGRPPSRTATPGQNSMMVHASPSMASRQPPGSMVPNADIRQQTDMINGEIQRLNNSGALAAIRQEAGMADKELSHLTLDDKQRLLALARQRSRSVKPGQPGPNNAAAGPSGSNPSMQPPNQRNQPPQPSRPNKRNSTSPGEEHGELPRNESSPPDRKRVRRSPEQTSMTSMSYPHGPPPQGAHGSQAQMPNGMMRGPLVGQSMNGFQPGMANMTGMGNSPGMSMQPMGQMGMPHMGNAMSPGMNHQGQMITPQMQYQREAQYRQSMHNLHKNHPPGGISVMPGSAGSPASTDLPFNPSAAQGQGPPFSNALNNRMGSNKPMMPPPSPALNGSSKDQNGQLKDTKPNISNGHPEGSPRNQTISGQNQGNSSNTVQGGTAPPTPVPVPNQIMTAPSPSAMLGNAPPPPMNQPELFSTDFIQSVASSLDEFDSSMFRADGGDINFERDFGQWFNPDDVGSLDLK